MVEGTRRLVALVIGLASVASSAVAQYAEAPSAVPAITDGLLQSATQIGRQLFIAGGFTRVSPPTGSAVVVDVAGTYVPGAFPRFDGAVSQVLADGFGGWFVVGAFTRVNGEPIAGFARVAADRSIDRRYRIAADGPVRRVAFAHGRIYLVGDFTTVNGATRRGFAVLDGATGGLSTWNAGFAPGTSIGDLSFSSLGVYLTVWNGSESRLWGFDAGSGRLLFQRAVEASALAASSARIYLGGRGSQRPLRAVDPLTGADTPWSPGVGFQWIRGPYEWDATEILDLALDGPRLLVTGRFLTTDGRSLVTAIDTASGKPTGWRPTEDVGAYAVGQSVTRVGPTVVVTGDGRVRVYDAASAARVPFAPATYDVVRTVAPAPEGAVIGGDFNGIGGVPRQGLAAIDLDTATVTPWTSPFPGSSALGADVRVATDGAWLFALTEGTLAGAAARLAKIDPATGAIVAERTWPSVLTRLRVAAGEIVVTTFPPDASAGGVGVVTIADWAYRVLPVAVDGWVTDLDLAGDTVYLAGRFASVGGMSRPNLAAVHRVTGAVLPWRPAPDIGGGSVRVAAGRVWVGGEFRRVGGQRRRGLAELDPVTGAALPWNPDVLGTFEAGFVAYGSQALTVGPDGHLYASVGGGWPFSDSPAWRSTVGGRETGRTVAFSPLTGRRLPWRPYGGVAIAVLPDCLLTQSGCLLPAVPAPSDLRVAQAAASIALTWSLPPALARAGVRLEVGAREGAADVVTIDLPADATSFSSPAPSGRFFARVRSLGGAATSMATPDVSFAVGPPDVPASPLDTTAVVDGTRVTIEWRQPSTGAPAWYELEAGTAEGRTNLGGLAVSGAATTLSVDAPPGLYWARVVAVGPGGRSAPGGELLIDSRLRQACGDVPSAPEGLTAAVAGRLVTLSWQGPAGGPQVDALRIVAGSGPGQGDLASFDVPFTATSFTVAAPPGVYYVRVAADNLCGTVTFSNEVRVVVS